MRELSPGEQIAGIGGLALLLTMFLFAWYGLPVEGLNGLDAFDAFSDWVNIILVFAAFAGMCLAVFGSGVARFTVSLAVITAVLGAISSVLLLFYLINPPGIPTLGEAAVEVDLDRDFGIWLGLISAIAVAFGGYKTMQEEGVSFGDAADRLSSSRSASGSTQTPPSPPGATQTPPSPSAPPPPPPGSTQAPPPPPAPGTPPPPSGS
jgi:hypothetical protein